MKCLFYSLVNRRFEIASRKKHYCLERRPVDATLDISPSMKSRTQAYSFNGISSSQSFWHANTKSIPGKRLDFLVYLYFRRRFIKNRKSLLSGYLPEDERERIWEMFTASRTRRAEAEAKPVRYFRLVLKTLLSFRGVRMVPEAEQKALARNSVRPTSLPINETTCSINLLVTAGFEVGFEVDSYTNGPRWQISTETPCHGPQNPLLMIA